MAYPTLRGCSILVVEGEARVVMEVATALNLAGATTTTTTSVHHAIILAEHDGLSAAILLSDGDRNELSARLSARDIPYVSYSGVPRGGENSVHLSKPVSMDELMKAMEGLLRGRPPDQHLR